MAKAKSSKTIDWDEKAANAFTQYQIDKKLGLEKDQPNVNISSMKELLRGN